MDTIEHTFAVQKDIAVAIINDDYSGLSDQECSQLETFEDTLIDLYAHRYLTCSDYSAEPEFMRCDVSGLLGDCLTLTLNPFPNLKD